MERNRYQETIAYLYGLLPAYQELGKQAFKKDLGNTIALCEALGNPQDTFKSILIGGTNGKGSVSSMLFSIMRSAGYSVGLYTSPHLLDFRERIRTQEAMISKEEVISFVEENKQLIEAIQPSFFEFTVAMAFAHFAQKGVEWAVVEVGLGGRLDSTNVLSQDLSLITNISLDHQDLLGETLPLIAQEKAGIIKRGVPTVIGKTQKETSSVFLSKALEVKAPIFFADKLWKVGWEKRQLNHNTFTVSYPPPTWEHQQSYVLDLNGGYQLENLPVVIEACRQLQLMGVNIDETRIRKGLAHTRSLSGIRGRMEVLQEKPYLVVDTGHNEAGVAAAWEQIGQLAGNQVHIVWGMVVGKEHEKILNLLPETAQYYFVSPQLKRGLPVEILSQLAEARGLTGGSFDTVRSGLEAALEAAKPDDNIWVGGSTFVVAEALEYWDSRP